MTLPSESTLKRVLELKGADPKQIETALKVRNALARVDDATKGNREAQAALNDLQVAIFAAMA